MLSEVLEISVDDVQPGSALGDLGVDSLMTTEVLSEIKSRFDVVSSFWSIFTPSPLDSRVARIGPSLIWIPSYPIPCSGTASHSAAGRAIAY